MTSIIKLQPLSGAMDEGPPCYLLQVDEFRFLLDCGWDEDFSISIIREMKRHLHQIDAVLLTYPDALHLGALPYLVGKCGLKCPVYATVPVYKMGQMFMYDLYQSRNNSEDFDMFTLDDVDSAFDRITQLKYSQTVTLTGKGHGLQITPLPAGHMIGGTIWKILKDGEEEIVYAVDYNHKKERHLNGCILEGKLISRPHLMITDAFNAQYNQSRRRVRDEQLMTTILKTMRADGNVMIAVDTAGRMLELAQLLDQMWRSSESGLTPYSLALLNNVSFNVVEFAKSQVEWMSDKIMRAFEDNRSNPYHFKHMKLCHNLSELCKIPEPKVVLCSQPDLQSGFSRDLFVVWCGNPKNSIILTNRTSPRTLARWLIDHPENKTVTLEVRRRMRLEGAELEEYMRKKQAEADAKKKEEAMDESSSESEAELEEEGPSTSASTSKAKHDIIIKQEGKSRGGFFKQAKKSYPMFPYTEEKMRWDEYGEIIRPEDYTITEAPVMDEEVNPEKLVAESDQLQDVSEVPTKCIAVTATLDINASIQYIDFEGRTDGESMRKILSQIKPRQLVLVHGSMESTHFLADHCRNTAGVVQGQVFTPKVGEIVDATTESHIFQVKLKDYLVTALDFRKAKDAELAWIDGSIDTTETKMDIEEDMDDDEDAEADELKMKGILAPGPDRIPSLEALTSSLIPGHNAVFINEPKLSDFKMVLLQEGIQAEFSAGALVCNETIAVRRNEAGRMQLEGAISKDYFKVRDLLYSQYAIV